MGLVSSGQRATANGSFVSKADDQGLALETITHAAQVMAGQISVEGVATALLNAGLTVSGAPRGIVALSSKAPFSGTEELLSLDSADMVRSRPPSSIEHLPNEIWSRAVRERIPQIRFGHDQQTAFPTQAGSGSAYLVSALCTPLVSRDEVSGFLYLEFDHGADRMTNPRLATMTLLASQAAMTLDAIRAFDGVRNTPMWQTRSQMIGRVATFRWSPKARLAEGPPEFYALLGLDPAMGPINYATMTKIQHPADYPRSQATVDEAVRRRAPLRMEWRLLQPTGEVRNLLWSGQFDTADPDNPWLQGVVMDITDLKAADDALRVAQEDADRQMRLAWLGELAGSIVHEINQPLSAITSSAEAALRWINREQPDLEAATQSIERIRELGHSAVRTVAGMRALSSSLPRDLTDRSLNALIAEALQVSGPLIGRADAWTEVAFDPSQPIIRCDPTQILQVVLNLIRNALDSLRETHGRERYLKIKTFVDCDFVTAEIEDNGIGISSEVAERLFNPLYTTKKDGMGLGLSICRRVIASHQGIITAKPNPPFGAIFAMSLPLTRGHDGAA
jgi:two-component system sensor kinase FixL